MSRGRARVGMCAVAALAGGCASGLLGEAPGADAGAGATFDAGFVPETAAPDAPADAPGATDGGADGQAPGPDACASRALRPWEGAGISTAYVKGDALTVISGDRYWAFDLVAGTWGAHGHVETLWATAPQVDGRRPWEGVGVDTSWVYGAMQTIISGDLYWTVDSVSGAWGASGHVEALWANAPANEGALPWNAPGVQTAYPYQNGLTVISGDHDWVLDIPSNGWVAGKLETSWAGVPAIDAKLPWQDTGVSASWVYGGIQTILSGDRYWLLKLSDGTWTTGHLETPWANVPLVDDCK